MVSGFVIHTRQTEIGRLARKKMASKAAMIICVGRGINAINTPINAASETDCRLRCQRLGSCNQLSNNRRDRCFFIQSGSGRRRFKNLRAIELLRS